ncbi:MAG: peptidoglycan-binding protein [Rhodobacteraceae bacterium]|nr:peptidoglycan-binding protein [Paracoccaceae bacterium]
MPSDKECEKITENGETLYLCDGVLYRSTYYEDAKVYEIVSDPPAEQAQPQSVVGLGLTNPFTRGEIVRELQNRLVGAGYDVGSVDGVFGSGTEAAVMWLQYDNGLDSSGVIDPPTATLLGYDVPGAAEPVAAPAQRAAPADPAAINSQAVAPTDPAPASDSAADGSTSEQSEPAADPEPAVEPAAEPAADPEPGTDAGADDATDKPQN